MLISRAQGLEWAGKREGGENLEKARLEAWLWATIYWHSGSTSKI